ncbi:MAG: hypothetical protein QME12_00825 [Nanoarchaeota archaeon]|nr:hypothetical protein [Nanoarchaeota archaeon]
MEQAINGKKPKHSFCGIVKAVDSGHIAYAAFELRKKINRTKAEEKRFISRLNGYLTGLESQV